MKPENVTLWHDDRAKKDERWVVTVKQGATVVSTHFRNRSQARAYAQQLKRAGRSV